MKFRILTRHDRFRIQRKAWLGWEWIYCAPDKPWECENINEAHKMLQDLETQEFKKDWRVVVERP